MPVHGPRIYVKRDEESSIGRGCVLYGGHFRPEIALIVWASCHTGHQIDEIRLTEGWRPQGEGRDLHPELRALDLVPYRDDERLDEAEQKLIASKFFQHLGPDYDVQAHDAGTGWHIHVELDPK